MECLEGNLHSAGVPRITERVESRPGVWTFLRKRQSLRSQEVAQEKQTMGVSSVDTGFLKIHFVVLERLEVDKVN